MPRKCLQNVYDNTCKNACKMSIKILQNICLCQENACKMSMKIPLKCLKNACKTASKYSLNNTSKMPRVIVALHYMALLSYGYKATNIFVSICCHFSPKANTSNSNDEFSKVRTAGISKCD
jgi:hypothetical protein